MNKTYYYPSSRGVTPADHDVAYWDEYQPDKETGGWRDWKAHLLIDNPLPFRAYLENIEGHYIKGVASWQEAHEELIDLVQAMLEELASSEYESRYDDEIDLLLARITDNYSDGTFIAIEAGYYVREQRIKVDVFGSRRAEMWVVQDEGLADKIHLKELQFPR